MLQSIRRMAQNWVVKGLLLFLIVSFSVWGIGDIFRGNPLHVTVAKVGSEQITVEMLNRSFEQALQRARQTLNPDLTAAQAKQIGVMDKALDGDIKRSLVEQDIKRLNIDVPPDAVLKVLADQPQFRNPDGSFNKDLFRQLLAQQGLNERNFVAKGQEDLARQILLDVLSSAVPVPQTEIDALYKARAQKRVLDVVTLDSSKLTGIPAPTDKELRDFYDQNPKLFTAPEYRSLTIAQLSTGDLGKDIAISDDEVKKQYDARGDDLATPEQRDLVQVVLQDEAAAKKLAAAARASGDLAAAAKEAKETAIPLDKMEEKNLLPELSQPVFTLAAGGIADPVKTQLGWHVIQVKHITPAGKPSFDAIKAQLRDDMQRDQAADAATRIVNQLDDQLAAGHSLDDIADELKLRLVKIPAVDLSGQTASGKVPAEFPNREQVLKDAFGQNAGETSPVKDDKAGNYYVVRTDDVMPSAVKPYDSVKDGVAEAWQAHEQMARAQGEAEKIEKALREGKPVSAFAEQDGVSIRASTPISALGDSDALLPPALVTQALKLKKGETTLFPANGKEIIVRVAQISDADFARADPRKNMIGGEIRQHQSDDRLDQYVEHLHDVFPVTINDAVLNQLQQQEN